MYTLEERKRFIEEHITALYRERRKLANQIQKQARSKDASSLPELIDLAMKETPDQFPDHAFVACQGIEGSNSQAACEKAFKYPGIMYLKDCGAVFRAIESGLCEYGVLPIENSTAGSVNQIYDQMRAHKFYIVKSIRVRIDHNLLANEGATLKGIKEVYSHPQAIGQSGEYLDKMGDIKINYVSNTAVAAKMVKESGRTDIAAISSIGCAAIYGLRPLATDIQDRDDNYTRFIVISKKPEIYPGADKTSIMAVLPHRPGSLCEMLGRISREGYDLVKLESRPIIGKDNEFMFYFDLQASCYDPGFSRMLDDLEDFCEKFEYLGSYREVI